MMHRLRHTQRAFTLIEVMVVVVIIAAFVGLAVFGLAQASERPLRQRASELESWLQDLSDRAVLEGNLYGVIARRDDDKTELVAMVWYRQHWFPVVSPESFSLGERYRVNFIDAADSEPDERLPDLVLAQGAAQGSLRVVVQDSNLQFDYVWQQESGHLVLQGASG